MSGTLEQQAEVMSYVREQNSESATFLQLEDNTNVVGVDLELALFRLIRKQVLCMHWHPFGWVYSVNNNPQN